MAYQTQPWSIFCKNFLKLVDFQLIFVFFQYFQNSFLFLGSLSMRIKHQRHSALWPQQTDRLLHSPGRSFGPGFTAVCLFWIPSEIEDDTIRLPVF